MVDEDEAARRLASMRLTTRLAASPDDALHRVVIRYDEDRLGLQPMLGAGPYVVTVYATFDGAESQVATYRVDEREAVRVGRR